MKYIKKFNCGKVLLTAILVLAAFLRFNQINSLPALNADEAAIGYNAYSLLETGRDEHGHAWPLHFQSFDDWKPGLYFYLVIPFIKFLGLTELAVRLPNFILSVASVALLYFLVVELTKNISDFGFRNSSLGLIAGFLLAINPWHIHFSRGGWEVSTASFFLCLGLWSFLAGLKKSKLLFLSAAAFAASMYTYHAARILAPMLGLALCVFYRKKIFSNIRAFLGPAVISFLLITPLFISLINVQSISRAQGVSFLADQGPLLRANRQRGEHNNPQDFLAVALHNRPLNYGLAFLENYASHFSGDFLFVSGDEIERNKVPQMGQMYLFSFLFLGLGFIKIAQNTSSWKLILFWLAAAPIPAALTFQSPHALRAQNMSLPLIVISAYGLLSLLVFLKNKFRSKKKLAFFYLLLLILTAWDFSRYLHQYYFHMSKTYDFSTQHGVKELVSYLKPRISDYENIVVTDRYDQPYILFLFYLQYPPAQFQKDHFLTPRDKFGFSTVKKFDKFVFTSINSLDKIKEKYPKALIAASGQEISEDNARIIKTINFPSGRPAFQIIK